MATQIQLRRGTASAWTAANTVLAAGEIGIETDTKKFKIGDGTTAWNSLPYNIALPEQTNQSGKYLTTNGTAASWGNLSFYAQDFTVMVSDSDKSVYLNSSSPYLIPNQTGNSGKYLTTNGTTASWAAVTTDPTQDIFMMMGV